METKNKLGILITLFIGVIFALAILPAIANSVQDLTTKRTIAGEAQAIPVLGWNSTGGACCDLQNLTINNSYVYTVTNAPDSWKINKCPLTSFTVGNSTENYTVTTDYVVTASAGTYRLLNTTTTSRGGNDTLVGYTYCDDGYITNSGGRSVSRLILIFSALAILGFAVYLGVKEYL